jgi:TRAP-type mannitol/chloroaromatic compound transport system substrate-binding protein
MTVVTLPGGEILPAASETFWRYFQRFTKANAEAYIEMTQKHKVRVWRTPDDILIKFLDTWDKMAEREAAKDPFFKKVLESQKKYASLVVPYRLSTWPSYEFAGERYWKKDVYGKSPK